MWSGKKTNKHMVYVFIDPGFGFYGMPNFQNSPAPFLIPKLRNVLLISFSRVLLLPLPENVF